MFFLAAPGKAGAVAVGAAHSFDRTRLAEVGELEIVAPLSDRPLAASRRYYARPGRAFHAPGASPRDDFIVFGLESAPQGARLLEPAAELPQPGTRVVIRGIRAAPPPPAEAALPGTVVKSGADAIEIDLEAPADLRGWGGAPVLRADDGRLIGLLQAAWPSGHLTRTSAGPIGGVMDAIAEPYEEGIGRLFATLAPLPSAANSPVDRRRAAAGSADGYLSPDAAARRLEAALAASPPRTPGGADTLQLRIETPEPDAIFGDAAGAFLAGSALAPRAGDGRFEVFLVIDTSLSTNQPSGADVDGDGERGAVSGDAQDGRSSDPGDSILAAEVAAAREIVGGLDPRRTRVGLVTFAGEPVRVGPRGLDHPLVQRAAFILEPLTSDHRRVQAALDELARSEPSGMTHMAAGIDLATLELLGLAGSVGSPDPAATQMILFFTDGQPTLPSLVSAAANVGAVFSAAERAQRAGVRIHSFAIGPEALAGPIAAVEMAAITRGIFTPVPAPGRLSEFVEAMRFAGVEEVSVRNARSGRPAHAVRLHADGSFDALVPLEVGKNPIEVRARGSRGEEALARVVVHYAPGAARPPLPVELVGRHNALLQRRVLELDVEKREQLRRELILEIARERERALERAAAQRKELDLRAETPR